MKKKKNTKDTQILIEPLIHNNIISNNNFNKIHNINIPLIKFIAILIHNKIDL